MRTSEPQPPENVQLVLRDGRSIPVDCRWLGYHDGTAHWEVITEVPAGQVAQIKVAKLPGRTSIAFPVPDGPIGPW